jgi:hypothetical protein
MPSFSFLKKQSEGRRNSDAPERGGAAIPADEKMKARRRQSKREFFRGLLSGGKERSSSQAGHREQVEVCLAIVSKLEPFAAR